MPRVAASARPAFVEERRSAILDAALRVWARRGFDGTSVAEIAREAGLTKGTLYLYFPSKQALLEATLGRHSLRPDVEAGLERLRGQPLANVVRGLVALSWRGLEARREIVGVLLSELPNHPAEARRFFEHVILPVNRLLADYLSSALPPARLAQVDPIVAGRSLVSMVVALFITQVVLGGRELLPIDEERGLATITELFLRGVEGPVGADA